MPWCANCDRFLSPSTVHADGTCPSCGRPVDPGAARGPAEAEAASLVEVDEEALPPVPWHLKLLVLALAVYLGWRLWQGLQWVGNSLW